MNEQPFIDEEMSTEEFVAALRGEIEPSEEDTAAAREYLEEFSKRERQELFMQLMYAEHVAAERERISAGVICRKKKCLGAPDPITGLCAHHAPPLMTIPKGKR